jgi:hypothetical protein
VNVSLSSVCVEQAVDIMIARPSPANRLKEAGEDREIRRIRVFIPFPRAAAVPLARGANRARSYAPPASSRPEQRRFRRLDAARRRVVRGSHRAVVTTAMAAVSGGLLVESSGPSEKLRFPKVPACAIIGPG